MNFQELKKGEYDYVQVGEWNSGGHFRINKSIQWPLKLVTPSNGNQSSQLSIPESVCSKPCPKGQAKVGTVCFDCLLFLSLFDTVFQQNIQSDSVKCCWVCVPCRENEYLTKEEKCEACENGTWPNEYLTGLCSK